MRKLTKTEVFERLEAALAILGEEECVDRQADNKINYVRHFLKQARHEPVVRLDNVANDVVVN